MFVIVNKSTRMSDADVKIAARACAHQLRYDAAPLFGLATLPVVYASTEADAPPGAYVIGVLDDPDQPNALGWHTEGPNDVIYGEVFVGPVLDHGGTPLLGELSVASVLSHEVLETFADPHANLWADSGRGVAYAYEICDPVESDSYTTTVYKDHQVSVSNFVTPNWFDFQAGAGERFDFLGKLTKPFHMTPGGYVITMAEGTVTQHFGEEFSEWRDKVKNRPNGNRRWPHRR